MVTLIFHRGIILDIILVNLFIQKIMLKMIINLEIGSHLAQPPSQEHQAQYVAHLTLRSSKRVRDPDYSKRAPLVCKPKVIFQGEQQKQKDKDQRHARKVIYEGQRFLVSL